MTASDVVRSNATLLRPGLRPHDLRLAGVLLLHISFPHRQVLMFSKVFIATFWFRRCRSIDTRRSKNVLQYLIVLSINMGVLLWCANYLAFLMHDLQLTSHQSPYSSDSYIGTVLVHTDLTLAHRQFRQVSSSSRDFYIIWPQLSHQ